MTKGLSAALRESPVKVLQGNQDLPIFFAIALFASGPVPQFNAYNTASPTGDPAIDAANNYTYLLGRDVFFGSTPPPSEFTASIDPITLVSSSAIVSDALNHFGGIPPSPTLFLGLGSPSGLSQTGLNPFDHGGMITALIKAVENVDFTPWWNNQQISLASGGYLTEFRYDRYDFNHPGNGPFDGQLKEIAGPGNGPSQQFSSADFIARSQITETTVVRVQYQIRNSAFGIECNFVEEYQGVRIEGGQPVLAFFYRLSPGTYFKNNLDIVEVPLPSLKTFPFMATDLNGKTWALVNGTTKVLLGLTATDFFRERQIIPNMV